MGYIERCDIALGPMNVYDTGPTWHTQFKQGAAVFPLTGLLASAFKVHISQRGTQNHRFGKGTINIVDATNAYVDYHWHSLDTNIPGIFDVWMEFIALDGSVISSANTETLQITNRKRGYSKSVMGRMRVSLT